jgi:hypothetical protein
MTLRVDQLLVKISGRAHLGQKLEIDQDVVVEGQVVKVETLSNQELDVIFMPSLRAWASHP